LEALNEIGLFVPHVNVIRLMSWLGFMYVYYSAYCKNVNYNQGPLWLALALRVPGNHSILKSEGPNFNMVYILTYFVKNLLNNYLSVSGEI
jgi:hypothetical protein